MKEFSKEELAEMQLKFSEQFRTGQSVYGKGGALAPLFKEFLESALEAELAAHLDEDERLSGNKRNGHKSKRVKTSEGELDISTPQDRHSSFDPQIIKKRERILADSLEDKIIGVIVAALAVAFLGHAAGPDERVAADRDAADDGAVGTQGRAAAGEACSDKVIPREVKIAEPVASPVPPGCGFRPAPGAATTPRAAPGAATTPRAAPGAARKIEAGGGRQPGQATTGPT